VKNFSPLVGLFSASLFFVAVSSCGKKDADASKVKIKPSLVRIAKANYTKKIGTDSALVGTDGATKTTDVKILSLKYPIGSISLSGEPPAGQTASASGNSSMLVYACPGANNDACLVDLAGTALSNLLANAPTLDATAGTYSQVNISPCFANGKSSDVRVKLKAQATIDGTEYFTNAEKGLSTTGPAEEVTFSPRSGCGSVKYLTKNIVIGSEDIKSVTRPVDDKTPAVEKVTGTLKEELNLSLYFDLANAVIAAGPSTNAQAAMETSDGDFCKGQGTRVNAYVCINFPEIVGTVDKGTPTLTRMLVNGNTIWGFYSNSDGVPFGAYQRGYLNGFYTQDPEFLVGSMFERFEVNADNSVSMKQYDDNQNRHIKVQNFKLANHSGTYTRGNGAPIAYTAEKLP